MRDDQNSVSAQTAPHSNTAASRDAFALSFRWGHLLPPVALIICGILLFDRMRGFDISQIWNVVWSMHPLQWGLAILASAASFLALGQYDAVIHRALRTGISARRARISGMRAIALSQVLGFGSLTSALVRWRCLPELTAIRAVHLSVLVSVSFLAAWSIVAALILWLGRVDLPAKPALLAGATAAAAIGLALPLMRHRIPRLRAILGQLDTSDLGQLVLWALLDTGFAAIVLGVFLWGQVDPMTLFSAYLVALGCGLLSNAPGGLGAFELTLMALLPAIPAPDLLAAILAYRLAYYALPALVAVPGLIYVRDQAKTDLHLATNWETRRILGNPPCPEWGLVQQSGHILLDQHGEQGWRVDVAGPVMAAIGPAFHGHPTVLRSNSVSARALDKLQNFAQARNLKPALYKCSAATAIAAQSIGWSVIRIASDAVIDLNHWNLDIPQRRSLRRKLRKSQKAGVEIRPMSNAPCWDEMTRVADNWADRHGGQRGFSMGRYVAGNTHGQVFFTAHVDGKLVAFVSFHATADKWVLDLMRADQCAPDGTMYALIHAGINAAIAAGATTVSLAAIPTLPDQWAFLRKHLACGLAQFKQSFAPRWQPLFLATPRFWQIPTAMWFIFRQIHHPNAGNMQPTHDEDANFGFDLGPATCDLPRQTQMLPVRTGDAHAATGAPDDKRSFPSP